MTETLTKSPKGQDAEKAQEKKRRLEPAPLPAKSLADESISFSGLLGVSAMEPPMESHVALLGDPRFSHSGNNIQKARMVTELQETYGNQYVQRLVESQTSQAEPTIISTDNEYERETDRVADGVTQISDSEVPRQAEEEMLRVAPLGADAIHRKAAPSAVASVGGREKATYYSRLMAPLKPKQVVPKSVAPGEKGFTRMMFKEIPVIARETFHYRYSKEHLLPVQLNLSELGAQIATRAAQWGHARSMIPSFAARPFYKELWNTRANDCGRHMQILVDDLHWEEELGHKFNTGIGFASQMLVSMAKLDALATMLGVDDPRKMSDELVRSLKEARGIALTEQFEEEMEIPSANATAVLAIEDLTIAQDKMNTAWKGVQQTLVLKRAGEIAEKGEDYETRKMQIEREIQAWKDFGTVIDVNMAVMGLGATNLTKARGIIGSMEVGERVNQAKGISETKKRIEGIIGKERIEIPKSASEILGTAGGLFYGQELRNISIALSILQAQIEGHAETARKIGLVKKLNDFQDATRQFDHEARVVANAMRQRQNAYIKFGRELDKAAAKRGYKELAPGEGKERFTTVMLVVAAVREVLAMAKGAQQGFGNDLKSESLRHTCLTLDRNRQMRVRGYPTMYMPREEVASLKEIYQQMTHFESNVEYINDTFGKVEAEAHAMMVALDAELDKQKDDITLPPWLSSFLVVR